jgi:dTDP-4-dehydrorhamnose reductase
MMSINLKKSPKSIYGKTKSEGEDSVLKVGDRISVLRLTKVVHENLPIFKKWAELLKQEKNIQAFTDLYFCPILIEDVIKALIAIGKKGEGGIYQVSGESDISYYEAAILLANILGVNPALVHPSISSHSGLSQENILRHTSLDTSSLPEELRFINPKPSNVLKTIFEKLI